MLIQPYGAAGFETEKGVRGRRRSTWQLWHGLSSVDLIPSTVLFSFPNVYVAGWLTYRVQMIYLPHRFQGSQSLATSVTDAASGGEPKILSYSQNSHIQVSRMVKVVIVFVVNVFDELTLHFARPGGRRGFLACCRI